MGSRKWHLRHLIFLCLWIAYIFAVYRGGILGGITGQSPREIAAITQRRKNDNQTSPLSFTGNSNSSGLQSQSLSFASILANIGATVTSSSLTGLVDSQTLRERYDHSLDRSIRKDLVTTLLQEGNYDDAYSYLMSGNAALIASLPPQQVMLILRNSSAIVSNTRIDSQTIMTMISRIALSESDSRRHIALISAGQGDKKTFLTQIGGGDFSGSTASLVNTILNRVATVQAARDMPDYYEDGLIALSLFEHGYIRLAQRLALATLGQNPDYILPQQLLAYSSLLAHEWREAAGYFDKLLSSDRHNSSQYQFFRGVCAYWLGEYANALLFFAQIDSNQITSDTIRYMINSYLALQDYNGASKAFKSLLGKTDMHNADMMLAREKIIFEPYMYNKEYSILKYNQALLDLYITRCQSGGFDATVCSIGTIARDIAQRKFSDLSSRLRRVNEDLPRSYLYYLLAESLIREQQIDEAKQMLVKSLSLTKDPLIQETIKKKLQSML